MIVIHGKLRQARPVTRTKKVQDSTVETTELKIVIEHETPARDNPDFMDIVTMDFYLPLEEQSKCCKPNETMGIIVRPYSGKDSWDVRYSAAGIYTPEKPVNAK